jgi:hypothetical protein
MSACCRHPDQYRRGRRVEAEATVERGSPSTVSPAAQLRIGAVKRAMLAIEVLRHPASSQLSMFAAGSTMSPPAPAHPAPLRRAFAAVNGKGTGSVGPTASIVRALVGSPAGPIELTWTPDDVRR